MNDWSSDPARILVAVPANRYAGLAILDGFGVPEGGFDTWNLDRWTSARGKTFAFASRLADAVERFKPSVVILGVPLADSDICRQMRVAAAQLLALPLLDRPVALARRLVLGRYAGSTQTEFAERIVTGFLPELKPFAGKTAIAVQYRRHAFEAVALALAELVERAPRSAVALARPEAFAMGTFAAAVQAADQRLHPEAYVAPS